MAEEVNNDAAEASEDQDQGTDAVNYDQMAFRYLSRSRKSLDLANRPGDEQASYYLSAAQVYAILELAKAIRES